MIKNELQSLLHNKLLLVVLVAIMLIPSIYAGLFLASMWDPYGELNYLPVAVVNKDRPVEYQGKELAVGDNLAEELKENDSMAFHVVDEETAKDGLEKGTYYMVVTIPEDFSENATTLMDENPKQMVLQYQTNPGKNYIAMKMSESAVKEIKKNISEEITRTYAENVFDTIQEIGDGFGDAIDGTSSMMDGQDRLAEGNAEVTRNLGTLADSSLTFKEGVDSLAEGLDTYTKGVASVDTGMGTLKQGVKSLEDSAVTGADTLAKGADTLDAGIGTYTSGVSTVKQGSDQLVANNTALNQGVTNVAEGVDQVKEGSSALSAGLKQMQSKLNASLTEEKVGQMQALPGQMNALNDNIQLLEQSVSGAGAASGSGAEEAISQIGQAQGAVQQYLEAAQSALSSIPEEDLGEAEKTALASIAAAQQYASASSSGVEALGAALKKQSDAVGGTISSLQENVKALAGAANQLLPAAGAAFGQLTDSSLEIQKAVNGQLVPGAAALDSGVAQLQAGINGENGLKNGITAYTAGVATLSSGLATLAQNNSVLVKGAGDLKAGSSQLSTGLSDGVKKLSAGVDTLSAGTGKLAANNSILTGGVTELSNGAVQLSDGAGKLRDGSAKIGDGMNELENGTRKLQSALKDGEKEIRDGKASQATLDMFAAPVETEGSEVTTVKNNGHAMAAYMMSVGLWVGCLAFCLMYPLTSYKELKSGMAWWASKAVVLYPLAVCMACVLMLVLHMVNGFEPESMARTLLVGVFASVAFMSVMYLFNVLLGKVGSFIMLIFMVLQLAGSAGTYPVEISGEMVPRIHKYMPFTYTVDAFRSAIAGGGSISSELTFLAVLAVVSTVLTVLVFGIRAKRIQEGKHLIYEWIEEKGLA